MPTISDVARAVGVSPMTVSRVLNHPEAVSAETRARVLAAIEALGYVPNAAARSLARGRTNAVALSLADIRNPYFANIARGVEQVAQREGYTLILGNSDERASRQAEFVRAVISRQVDGIIVSASGDGESVKAVRERGIPLVLIDRKVPGVAADVVTHDSTDGARQLVAHLVERGYREIGFIGGPAGVSTLTDRVAGYRAAMRAAGLEPRVRLGEYTQASGERIVGELLGEGALPGALIAANNFVAVGAIVALRSAGLSVPEDVGLACFGDLEVAAMIDPFLTVVAHPAYEIGEEAMRFLLDRIRGDTRPPRRRVLPVSLVVRRSTPGPRPGRGS